MHPTVSKKRRIKIAREKKAEELSKGVLSNPDRAKQLLKESRPGIGKPIVIGTQKQKREKRKLYKAVVAKHKSK